jgi:nucleoid DNA-binding protein
MSDKTVTKQEIVDELAQSQGCTKREASDFLEAICGIVSTHLKSGRDVRLTHVGRLYVERMNPRQAYNPRDRSQLIAVPARMKAKFKASKALQEDLDKLVTE